MVLMWSRLLGVPNWRHILAGSHRLWRLALPFAGIMALFSDRNFLAGLIHDRYDDYARYIT